MNLRIFFLCEILVQIPCFFMVAIAIERLLTRINRTHIDFALVIVFFLLSPAVMDK